MSAAAPEARARYARALRRDPRARRSLAELVEVVDRCDGAPVLDTVVRVLPSLLGAEMGCAYRAALHQGGGLYLDFFHEHGAPPSFRERYDAHVGRSFDRASPAYDVLHPETSQRNVVFVPKKVLPPGVFEGAPAMRDVFQPLRIGHHDHVRALVCDGSLLLAWVGVVGSGRYGDRELALLDGLIAPLARRLRLEARLRDGARDSAALDALLAAVHSAVFLVRESRFVVYANAVGKRLLDLGAVDPIECMQRARVAPDRSIEIRTLSMPGLPEHALVVIDQPRDDLEARLAVAALRWSLTPRQVGVLRLLATGEPNKTIAERLRCAVVTVENHVTALLRRSGTENRASLIAKFWTLKG